MALSRKYENIYYAVGVHPYDVDSYNIDFLKRFIDNEKCVAVGECGLDYYRLPDKKSERERVKLLQKRVFKRADRVIN